MKISPVALAPILLAVLGPVHVIQLQREPESKNVPDRAGIVYLSENGTILPSLFHGWRASSAAALSSRSFSGRAMDRTQRRCDAGNWLSSAGLLLTDLFSVETVQAQFCDDGWCGGHFMALNPTPPQCGTECGGGTWDQYISDPLGSYYWHGYRFNGSTTCSGCRCQEIFCFNLG